jgi:hypothetical protein
MTIRILVTIMSVLYSLSVSGQRYSHLNVFEGKGVLSLFHIVVNNTEENEYYVHHEHDRDSLWLNDQFVAYSNGTEDASFITRFNDHKAVKRVKIAAQDLSARIHYCHDKIWYMCYRMGALTLNNKELYPAPDPLNPLKNFSGCILVFNRDLELDTSFVMEDRESPNFVTYREGKYYVYGTAGATSDTVKLGGVSLYKPFISMYDGKDIFMFELEGETYRGLSGLIFGGESYDTPDRVLFDGEGNKYIYGTTEASIFKYKQYQFQVVGDWFFGSYFILKVDEDDIPVYFHYFDGRHNDSEYYLGNSDIKLDAEGNLYLSSVSSNYEFYFDNRLLYQSSPGIGLMAFMKLDRYGNLAWTKFVDCTNQQNALYNYMYLKGEEVIFAGRSISTSLILDGEIIQPIDSLLITGMITFDREEGRFRDHEEIVPGLNSLMYAFEPMANGNILVALSNYKPLPMQPDTFFTHTDEPFHVFLFEFNPEIRAMTGTLDEAGAGDGHTLVYPNPVQRGAALCIDSDRTVRSGEVYDLGGRLVTRVVFGTGHKEMVLPDPGTYIVKILYTEGPATLHKLLVK